MLLVFWRIGTNLRGHDRRSDHPQVTLLESPAEEFEDYYSTCPVESGEGGAQHQLL